MAGSAETTIKSGQREGVLHLLIDGPETRNSIGPAVYEELQTEIIRAGVDPSIRAVVISGADGFFSSGGNIKALRESAQGTLAEATKRTDKLGAMIQSVIHCPKPVVGAVEGGAAGVAVGLALACDLIVSSRTAKFTIANVKVGLSPDGGATFFLRSALPRQIVMEICLMGTPIPATRMFEVGMINNLTPEGRALETAFAIAGNLASGPENALATTKKLINTAPSHGLAAHLDEEARAINLARFEAEAAEGLAAFLEKRPADFSALPVETALASARGRTW